MDKRFTTIELFAGIGGFRVAADNLGLDTLWANDINKDAAKVYTDNYGSDRFVLGDINEHFDSIPDHDLLTGGFPCQPFSKAGKKLGVDDYRGTLFEAIVKILVKKHPSFFVLENVNSLLYMDNGRNFQVILNALASLDYKIEWRVFNAMEFGLPQHRERVIIIGARDKAYNSSYFMDFSTLEGMPDAFFDTVGSFDQWTSIQEDVKKKTFSTWGMAMNGRFVTSNISPKIPVGLTIKSILQDEVPEEFDFTEDTKIRLQSSVKVDKFYNGVEILYNQAGGARMGYSIFGTNGVAPTLTASTSRHYERYKIGDCFRRLTNVEYARLQGFSDNHCKAVSPYNQYKLYGNAVPHQIVQHAMDVLLNNRTMVINKRNYTLFD